MLSATAQIVIILFHDDTCWRLTEITHVLEQLSSPFQGIYIHKNTEMTVSEMTELSTDRSTDQSTDLSHTNSFYIFGITVFYLRLQVLTSVNMLVVVMPCNWVDGHPHSGGYHEYEGGGFLH